MSEHPDWHEHDKGWAERERGFALAKDLAEALRTGREYLRTWVEVPCGAARVDVFAMRPRWGGLHDTRAYEVKINRRDFVQDVREMKFAKAFPACRRFYYAVPSGLVKKDEVPPGCGLIVKTERGGWRVMVQPAMRDVQPSVEFLIGLLNHHDAQEREQRRLRDRVVARENVVLEPQTTRMGREIAQMVSANRRAKMLGEVAAPQMSEEERSRRQYADELLVAVEGIWKAAREDGLFDSHVPPRVLANAVTALMRDAEGLREIGRYLHSSAFSTPGAAQAVIAKLGKGTARAD